METNDYQNVIEYTRTTFMKNTKSKTWLPSILSISADLIDVHKKDMMTNCKAAWIEIEVDQEKQQVQFYVYDESHTLIFKPAYE